MAELTVIKGAAKDNGESVVTRWEKQRGVTVWHKDRRSLVNLINNAIEQQDRADLARKVIETVDLQRLADINHCCDKTITDVVLPALRELFRVEGVEVE